jgi:hypothetical protein
MTRRFGTAIAANLIALTLSGLAPFASADPIGDDCCAPKRKAPAGVTPIPATPDWCGSTDPSLQRRRFPRGVQPKPAPVEFMPVLPDRGTLPSPWPDQQRKVIESEPQFLPLQGLENCVR